MSDTFIDMIDPEKFESQLREAIGKREATRDEFATTLERGQQAIQSTQDSYTKTIDMLAQSANQALTEGMDAATKITEASTLPVPIANIIGIFDSDYNMRYQRARATKSQVQLQATGQKIDIAEKIRNSTVTQIQTQMSTAEGKYQLAKAGLSERVQLAKDMYDLTQSQATAIATKAEAASDQEIRQWISNPKEAPSWAQSHLGLLQQEYTSRTAASLQLSIQQDAYNERLKARKVQLGYSDEDILKLANGDEKVPTGFTQQMFKDELRRRQGLAMEFQSAKAALQTNNIKLLEAKKENILQGMNPEEIAAWRSAAKQNGGTFTADGIQFNLQELTNAWKTANTREQEADAALSAQIMAQADAQIAGERLSDMASRVALQNSGGMAGAEDSLELVDPKMRDVITRATVAVETADGMAKAQLVSQTEASVRKAEVLKKALEDTEKLLEEKIKILPTKQQGAAREFYETGRVTDEVGAAEILVANGTNPFALDASPLYSGAFQAYSATQQQIQEDIRLGKQSFVGGGEGATGFSFFKEGKADNTVIAARAIETSKARTKFATDMFVDFVTQQLLQFAKTEERDSNAQPFWQTLVNTKTGQLAPELQKVDPATGRQLFDLNSFARGLSMRSIEARKSGAIPADTDALTLLTGSMRSLAPQYVQANAMPRTMQQAAFYRAMFGEMDPTNVLYEKIGKFRTTIPEVLADVEAEMTTRQRMMEEQVNPVLNEVKKQLNVGGAGPIANPLDLLQLFNRSR